MNGSGSTLNASAATTLPNKITYTCKVPSQGLKVTGSATFAGDTLTFVVPDDWKECNDRVTLLDAPGIELSAASAVRVVTESGIDFLAIGKVTVAGGKVTAYWAKGLAIIVQ